MTMNISLSIESDKRLEKLLCPFYPYKKNIQEPIIVPNGSLYFYTNITERVKKLCINIKLSVKNWTTIPVVYWKNLEKLVFRNSGGAVTRGIRAVESCRYFMYHC